MNAAPAENWLPQQRERLRAYGVRRAVDIHCHCLPAMDDGPETLTEGVALCQALAEDGITTVMATPHQLGSFERTNSDARVRAALAELSAALREAEVPLELFTGGDIRLDERLPRLLDTGEICTLAGAGRHLLLEPPFEVFIDPMPMIELLTVRGLQPIVTHPERYPYLAGHSERLRGWIAAGAVLQVTAGSLLGEFGRRAAEQGWDLVTRGLVDLVATDAHDARRRPPRMSAALAILEERAGRDAARALCLENPLRVLDGQSIERA